MTEDDASVVNFLLELKYKAAKDISWTHDEIMAVRSVLQKGSEFGVLAACCVLALKYLPEEFEGYGESLEVVKRAMKDPKITRFMELSIYEVLTGVDAAKILYLHDDVFQFIAFSLKRRLINLDNVIFLLGGLVRLKLPKAITLLKSLENDDDDEVKYSVGLVLQGLERDQLMG